VASQETHAPPTPALPHAGGGGIPLAVILRCVDTDAQWERAGMRAARRAASNSIDAHQRKNPSYPANCECVSPLGPSNGDPGGRPPCACFNWRQRCSSARMDERISRFTPVFREEGPERVTCSVYRCPSAPGIRRALRRGDRAFVRIIHFTPADAFRQVQKPRYFPDVAIWKARCGCYRERFSVGSRTDRRKPADYAPPE